MKFQKEYQEHIKKVTDQFIKMLTGDCPDIFIPELKQHRKPTGEEINQFHF